MSDYFGAKFDQGKAKPVTSREDIPRSAWVWSLNDCFFDRPEEIGTYLKLWAEQSPLQDTVLGCFDVLRFGERKYEYDSWRHVPNGIPRYLDAWARHVDWTHHYPAGILDPESGLPHNAHAMTNAAFVLELLSVQRNRTSL